MNAWWNTTPAIGDPVVSASTPGLVAEMDRLWAECNAEAAKSLPRYLVVPSWWFEKRPIKRQVIRRRGKTFVVRALSAILKPSIATQFGMDPNQVPERLRP